MDQFLAKWSRPSTKYTMQGQLCRARSNFELALHSCPCVAPSFVEAWEMLIRYKAREARKADERHKAFEAVFSDPELDLEEVAAQVKSQSLPYMCH